MAIHVAFIICNGTHTHTTMIRRAFVGKKRRNSGEVEMREDHIINVHNINIYVYVTVKQ